MYGCTPLCGAEAAVRDSFKAQGTCHGQGACHWRVCRECRGCVKSAFPLHSLTRPLYRLTQHVFWTPAHRMSHGYGKTMTTHTRNTTHNTTHNAQHAMTCCGLGWEVPRGLGWEVHAGCNLAHGGGGGGGGEGGGGGGGGGGGRRTDDLERGGTL
jgi:hypothetical protein